ncbi:MAG: alpha/beta hydrolase [Bacteroidales bacterium]|nr:alpha/beta hydrolase [Bacteroidales bacterium]
MKKISIAILIICLFGSVRTHASYKVYVVHGYGGLGLELNEIHKSIKEQGYESEIYTYPSLIKDIDSVGVELFHKIQQEGIDTVSFVTHSMGGMVVRSLYSHLHKGINFPFIHRIVMIAPPNNGSPVADSLEQYELIRFLVGPNIVNLTTDTLTGAHKYPIPTAELGVIIGIADREKWMYSVPLIGDNDGVVMAESAKMGVEKDIVYVKASHIALVFNEEVRKQVVYFLKEGVFERIDN